MSSLLEQAIIDATALREAAVKNAESAILDKYSTDIREAVESLLEQDDESPSPEASANLEASIPYASGNPTTLGDPAADDDAVVTMDLDSLISIAEKLTAEEEGEPASHEAAAPADAPLSSAPEDMPDATIDVALEEELDLDIDNLDELIEELVVDITPQKSGWAGTPENIMN